MTMIRTRVGIQMSVLLGITSVLTAQGCYEAHPEPGCDDPACEALVCAQDDFCCTDTWDETCVTLAEKHCGGGGGGAGNCKDAIEISIGDVAFDTTGATEVFDLTGNCDPGPYGDDALYNVIWFKWTCENSGAFVLSTCNQANFDTRLAVLAGTCDPVDVVACLDDADGCAAFSTRMGFEAIESTEYIICVGGYSATDLGTGTLSLNPAIRSLHATVAWTVEEGAPEDTLYEMYLPAVGSTTWAGCNAEAKANGESLASIASEEENAVIAQLLGSAPAGVCAIGLFQNLEATDYAEPAGGWEWTDGTPMKYTNWGSTEPNDTNGAEHWGNSTPSGFWNDNFEDAVGGWTNYIVKRAGSPFEYVWPVSEGGNGNRYEAFGLVSALALADAPAFAKARGGHLLTISSAEENAMVIEHLVPTIGTASSIALGLIQNLESPDYVEPAGGWEWVTGEPTDYINWKSGEPNDLPAGEDAVFMYSADGFWNDVTPAWNCPVIVIEYEAGGGNDCPTDLNDDDQTDGGDLTILLGSWNNTSGPADINNDGLVDGADLTLLLGAWGACS